MRLRFFGRLRDAVGAGEIELALPPGVGDSEALRAWLARDYPALGDPSVRIALDDTIVAGNCVLGAAQEAAFLPPVSGG